MNEHPRPADRHPWVVVPGIWGSDPEHWQSRWQDTRGAAAVRIAPTSWSEPEPGDWDRAISDAVAACGRPPVLVAHSLGVLAAAHWLAAHDGSSVVAAFLVAPPDPDAPAFPEAARGFRAPSRPVASPTALVVSDDDPYCSVDRAEHFATVLGARTLRVGARQHVNVASGVGAWDEGRRLLDAFVGAVPEA
ncbi:serine hydrolase family protein [Curtobacterium sp. MCSS17_008]|uniref:RBBP9/YdeN family alpha/beta hydrolase n=1 Tax=Curtobacterium sp. MCSS17_008 TaxID=2175647 RepID=UPI000DA982A0|nr:alpha/beta fold hydrolase [Curtobacterium sp. MCSS17_008]PZF59569.1 serine hydrolase family protein [Curtobacterium sp. MCSS17_008]